MSRPALRHLSMHAPRDADDLQAALADREPMADGVLARSERGGDPIIDHDRRGGVTWLECAAADEWNSVQPQKVFVDRYAARVQLEPPSGSRLPRFRGVVSGQPR
jgi:hypothetical protein